MSKIARKTIVSVVIVILALSIAAFCFVSCNKKADVKGEVKVTDMIGREVAVTPGSYQRVVCIGAGALRMYSYIGDVSLLAGIEDIENTTLQSRPKMFDQAARPYQLANKEVFNAITSSCGVGGPQAQAAEAEKILACNPDIVISEYEDVEKEDALQAQLGVPVITVRYGANGVFDENVKNSFTLLGKIFGMRVDRSASETYLRQNGKRRGSGQAFRLYLRPRQLGHNKPPYDCPKLRAVQRCAYQERSQRSCQRRHSSD